MLYRRLSWLFVLLFVVLPPLESAPKAATTEWHLTKPARHPLPSVKNSAWIRNGIDAFILEKLEAKSLRPAAEASRRTLIRRLYFDLLGLPPTPGELVAFLNDPAPNAYELLVDRLLADPRFGERWGRFWLDLARYADTAGYEGDPEYPHAWRYRDYVVDAFNHDKPYDVFVKEQIAGDEIREIMGAGELPLPNSEHVVAMTFLRLAPFTEPRGDETRHEMLSEITSTVGSVFLGLTVGCAKCHDHKYDRIPIKDFYRMKAFFATVQLMPPERGDGFQIGGPLPADFYRPGEAEWADDLRARAEKELEQSRRRFQELTKELEAKIAAAGFEDTNVNRFLGGNKNSTVLSAEEKAEYRGLRGREYQLKQKLKRLRPLAMSLRHSFGPPFEPGVPTSRVMLRGEYDNPGEVIEPGFPSAITGNQEPAEIRLDPFKRWPTRSRRMTLASWIASPDNPLTARVMVNRLWHHHFGRGIVSTPSDFGVLGDPPTHPELLDWLAHRFVDSDWSLKAMHRLMLTSSAYRQQSARIDPEAEKVDLDNKLLWRFRRQRLEGEAVRDAVLAVSGRLNPEIGGLAIFPVLPEGIDDAVKYSINKWENDRGPRARRRSLYIFQQRTMHMPFLATFDALVQDMPCDRRRASVTSNQPLAMYNSDFVNDEVSHFAARVRRDGGKDPRSQIDCAFEFAFNRLPSEDEARKCLEFFEPSISSDEALTGICRILYNSNEFVYID